MPAVQTCRKRVPSTVYVTAVERERECIRGQLMRPLDDLSEILLCQFLKDQHTCHVMFVRSTNSTTRVPAGGNVGLMGQVARAVIENSRKGDDAVVAFIPESMADREVSGHMLGRTQIVSDMHERKAAMAAEAEAFIALPGGFGTMEELMEMVTCQQLGFHSKPVGILDVDGFYNLLLAFFDHCVTEVCASLCRGSRDVQRAKYAMVRLYDDQVTLECWKYMQAGSACSPKSRVFQYFSSRGRSGSSASPCAAATRLKLVRLVCPHSGARPGPVARPLLSLG
jgi:uncharacterized protein (TIGR00730 family)